MKKYIFFKRKDNLPLTIITSKELDIENFIIENDLFRGYSEVEYRSIEVRLFKEKISAS
jgi:hypothetical protein